MILSIPATIAVTFRAGDWGGWIFLAFISGLAAAFIARPQGAGCFGFGCFGNLLIGAIGAVVGQFVVSLFFQGEVGFLPAFAISLAGALLVLFTGQAIDRLLRRNTAPAHDLGPPPQIIDGTAREARREIDEP